ncbi:WW domain-binding protein 2 [Culicoides brevitarsis]|uniref:WW domain-binding protein 2 n=1 Tax=Culicoides brevitarsis TaxID=469753 RepID=UPI00307C11F7
MSVNTAHANNGVLIHAGESILLYSDNVSMEFSGQGDSVFRGTKNGRIYLTTHRIIFNAKDFRNDFKSFSAPFVSMNEVKLEQPTFGANYIKGIICAQQNGGFTGEVKFKLSFKSGGAIDFGQAMLRAASLAKNNAGGYAPPPYEPPTGNWYQAPPPAYTPTAAYGWLPNNPAFTNGPDPNTVFMHDQPPPYPGVNPNPQQQPAFNPHFNPNMPDQFGQQNGGYPPYGGQQPNGMYPNLPTAQPGYPPQTGYPQPGYPGQAPYPNAYPGAMGGWAQPPAYNSLDKKQA